MCTLTRGERFEDARKVYNRHGNQTMDEVTAATGVKKSMIQALEDDGNNRSVGYDKVAKLAAHYGVSVNWLLCLDGDYHICPSAVDELGLSQKNTDFLKDPSIAVGRPITVPRFNMIARTLINDIIDICREKRLDNDFQMMMHILKRHYGLCYMEEITDLPSSNEVSRYIEHKGLFVLNADDGIEYFANKIGSRISHSLKEKYYDSKEEAHKMYADMLSEKGKKE